jgi:hypothetical protein
MRGFQVGVALLSALVMSGCPFGFGKDGRIDKAARKDTEEQLGIVRCSEKYREKVCARGRQDSAECVRCGGP